MMTTGFDQNGTDMIRANAIETEVAAYFAANGHSLVTLNTEVPCSIGNILYTTTLLVVFCVIV